jgi:hypothetical protein
MDRIELKFDNSPTERVTYTFWLDKVTLVLDYFIVEHKEKRTWKIKEVYNRLSNRDSSLKESDVILTDEIKKMAIEKYITDMFAALTVQKWSEYKKR